MKKSMILFVATIVLLSAVAGRLPAAARQARAARRCRSPVARVPGRARRCRTTRSFRSARCIGGAPGPPREEGSVADS